jgi:hypothetical protein
MFGRGHYGAALDWSAGVLNFAVLGFYCCPVLRPVVGAQAAPIGPQRRRERAKGSHSGQDGEPIVS